MEEIEIFSDGGSRGNPGPASCAFVVYHNKKIIYKKSVYLGVKTNNQAEYLGVVTALSWLIDNVYKNIKINYFLDSELVVKQLNGIYKIKSDLIKPLVKKVKELQNQVGGKINFIHVKRHMNKIADRLVNENLDENV